QDLEARIRRGEGALAALAGTAVPWSEGSSALHRPLHHEGCPLDRARLDSRQRGHVPDPAGRSTRSARRKDAGGQRSREAMNDVVGSSSRSARRGLAFALVLGTALVTVTAGCQRRQRYEPLTADSTSVAPDSSSMR